MYDLIVIGGGPAGYVAAIRATQLGMRTAIFEKNQVGGTCLNVGCIPTKALFHSAALAHTIETSAASGVNSTLTGIDFGKVMQRKDMVVKKLVGGVEYLLKKNKVDVIEGAAKFTSTKKVVNSSSGKTYEAKNILIATGSENSAPPIPGMDGKNVLDSTALLSLGTMPKSIAIIGGGVIGCEFANIFSTFGAKVTVVEKLPAILANMEASLSLQLEKQFKQKGIEVLCNTRLNAVHNAGKEKEIVCTREGRESVVRAEYVLVATGRKPCGTDLALDRVGVKTTDCGWVKVDDFMQTSVPGIYAAGDVTGMSFLAHAAFEEGIIAVENMKGARRKMNYRSIPKAVFVETEISSVGLTEKEAKAQGYDVLLGYFNMAANGKALTMDQSEGFVKVVSEKKNHEILGIHMMCSNASEMVTTATTLLATESLLEDVAATIYPHPSVSEALREACLDALGMAIHA